MSAPSALLDREAAKPFAGQRVLLTGASGFLGAHVARQALAAGVELHRLGRSAGPEGALHHCADLTDRASVASAVQAAQPQAVIHCAAPGVAYGSMPLAEMLVVAAGGTEALLDACAALAQPPRLVLVGSGFEYAPSHQPVGEDWPIVPSGSQYGAAKAAAACMAGAFAERLALTLVRPFHIYGAGEAARRLGPFLIAQARAGQPVELTPCEQQRDFLHVDDCAAMVWAALEARSEAPGLDVLNLGSGQPIALRTFVDLVSAELAHHGVTAQCTIGALPYRAGEPMVSLPNLARWQAQGLRGPRVSLQAGVADLVRAELEQ
jgi:nucleoside-diphosphate-sugar epimerase